MFQLSKTHLAVFSALALGSALPVHAAVSFVAGKVIAGSALAGATVCADKNRNKACDTDEIKATSGADGSFSLSGEGADQYPVIVEIAKTATRSAYTLEAPVGKHAVISPFTTLVQNEIDNDTGMSLADAEGLVSRDFLVSSSALYADYSGPAGDAVQKAKATVLADVFARQMQEAEAVGPLTTARRAAAAMYARNMAGQRAIKIMEAITAAGGDASLAADKMDYTDASRLATLEAIEGQKLYAKVTTKAVKDVYLNNMTGALSYDASTQRVKFAVQSWRDGEILRVSPTATTPDLMALDTLAKAPLTRVASYAALPDGSVRVLNNAKSETVWTTMETDLAGQTFRLSQLVSASTSPSVIPADRDIQVTFQAGDKMWREHHSKHPFGPDQLVLTATKDTGVASLEAWVKSKNDAFNTYDTLALALTGVPGAQGSYTVYFKPTDAANPLAGGDIIGYNITAKTETQVGTYSTRVINGTTYLIAAATMLTRMNSAAEKVFVYDAATKTVKYAAYRDYVRFCLCWQRKMNVSALNRIADALRAAKSPLITAATTTSTATGHYVMPSGAIPLQQGFASVGQVSGPAPLPPNMAPSTLCGGCVLGNCGACPVAEVLGMR